MSAAGAGMSGEPCQWCERARAAGRCGRYHLSCVTCCARLVRSCRPWKAAQEAMLAVIARQPGRPSKAQVLAALRELDAQADVPAKAPG